MNDAAMALISDQAFTRHQYHRRMKTRPVPAPRPISSFQPCSTLLQVAMTTSEQQHQGHGREPGRDDLGSAAGLGPDEAEVHIVDQVGRAPVEMGADGAHVRRGEGGEQQALDRGGKHVHHHSDVALLGVGQAGIADHAPRSPPGSRARGAGRSGRSETRAWPAGRGARLWRPGFAARRTRRRPAPAPGYQAAHHWTLRKTRRVESGSQALSTGGSTPKAAS